MSTRLRSIEISEDAAALIEQRADERGVTVSQFLTDLVFDRDARDPLDQSTDVAELERRWASIEANGKTVPNRDVVQWLKTWGTLEFEPWRRD